jgi:hypothetical protein
MLVRSSSISPLLQVVRGTCTRLRPCVAGCEATTCPPGLDVHARSALCAVCTSIQSCIMPFVLAQTSCVDQLALWFKSSWLQA